MNPLTLVTATLSHPGGRALNEDAAGHADGCWVLADGLGGHGGGEVAAQIAVDTLLAAAAQGPLTDPEALAQALLAADVAIHTRQEADPRLERMRTTVVVLASDGCAALWAHVGDSRLYHFRDGRIRFQTADHSVPQALVKAGEITAAEVRFHEDRNRLLRTLGNDKDLRPTLAETLLPLATGDAFLLCTDGWWEYVTEPEMEVALAKSASPAQWLQTMATGLLRRAPMDHDNFTAIALFVA
ncbi:protein phosphatase 2C domain-containing protein [uncultured Lamprocystis sp.]|jgi:serine/threonine protein phosphatase PrpC|uniref:PP2C family protein-serine/threonine phosphatase n=1 Tax=uncultured Lamprocystis sp. TaxID=543132 RepID=UPI0025D65853|nr:protein phosphatase 2C domain-containing protein [uncultured Lamprocystis sp.]